MNNLFKDIRYALRSLLRHPAFTVVAVITLALGIGANTAIFSVVNGVLLRALPFPSPERLVQVGQPANSEGLPGLASYEYLAWQSQSKDFETLAAYSNDNFNLTGLGEPERISCGEVTASFFSTFAVPALRGRAFLPEEDKPGTNNAVVVSEAFWQKRFGGSDSVIGSTLTLDDKPYTIVGVMPHSFRFPSDYEIWVPMALDPIKETQGDMIRLVEVVGRLRPNATPEHAQAELNVISHHVSEPNKDKWPTSGAQIVPLHQFLVAGVRRTVLILWGAVGLLMLLACTNVASLMLSRTVSRRREMAVRAAVGARRWQLVRQLLTESVVLGLAGGILGALIAVWCKGLIASLAPEGLTNSMLDLNGINMDWRVFAFTLLLSVLTGVVFGLVPASTASRPDLVRDLREGSFVKMFGFGLRSIRGWLVVVELGLAMVLLLAAGLLVRSFNQLLAIDLGFAKENVLTFKVGLPRSKYAEPQTINFYGNLLERLKVLPGVQSVGTINHTPLSGFGIEVFTGIEGVAPSKRKDPAIGVGSVSPDYFRTMKIPLVSGRVYDERDTADSAKVGIVNQAFAQRYFGGADAVGKHVGFGCKSGLCRTIVGVVGNVRQQSLTADVAPEMFVPFLQMPMNGMTVLMRTAGDPLTLATSVRQEVLAIDPNQPVHELKSLEQRVAESVAVTRSLMFLFSAFALLALVLASVGIYGIVSYSVTQRTHEIGIRMALGAQRGDVLRLIMRNGLTLAVTGIIVGIGGAVALTRFMTVLLFGIKPTDVKTFVFVSIGLLVISIVACLIPARRATKVDPLKALRYE